MTSASHTAYSALPQRSARTMLALAVRITSAETSATDAAMLSQAAMGVRLRADVDAIPQAVREAAAR